MSETVVFSQHQRMLHPLELVWLSGPQKGKRSLLIGGRQTFGRDDKNDLVIADPTVSTHHGALNYSEEGQVLFYDAASRNGISRDGKKAPVITLKPGQNIQIGSVYLQLVRPGLEPAKKSQPYRKPLLMSVLLTIGTFLFLFLRADGNAMPERSLQPAPESQRAPEIVSVRPVTKRRRVSSPVSTTTGSQRVKKLVQADQAAEQGKLAFDRGEYLTAYQSWKQTALSDPSNQVASEGLQKLEQVAGKFYEEALMTKGVSPDQSRRKLEMAAAITDPGSEVHQQASQLAG